MKRKYKRKKENPKIFYRVLEKGVKELNKNLTRDNVQNFFDMIGSKRQILWRNLLAGIARGIGIGIGVTIITAVIIILLQKIVTLNIPVIGEYISDIVKIVEKDKLK